MTHDPQVPPPADSRQLDRLTRSDNELTVIFDSDALAIAVVEGGVVVRCNAKCERLFGFDEGTLVGQPVDVVFFDGDTMRVAVREVLAVFEAGSIFRQDQLRRKRDGSELWLRVTGASVDQADPGKRAIWLFDDITQARANELRLQQTFDLQQQTFDNAAVGLMFASRRKIVRCNRRLAAIFGYQYEELVGQSTRIFYASDEEYRTVGLAGYAPILAGKPYVHEMVVRHTDGTHIWVRATGQQLPLSKPGEDIIWVFEDVTDRHIAQDALRAAQEVLEERVLQRTQELEASQNALRVLNAELEHRVALRTAELSDTIEDLRQTQAELVQADKLAALGSMVAGIAHELNTPLGNALMSASTLSDRFVELQTALARGELRKSTFEAFLSSGQEIVSLVLRSTHRAADLVSSFKQVAVDQTTEQRRIFFLDTLVEDVVSTLRPSMRNAPWIVETHVPKGIRCDSYPGPLGQIVANMVNNAVAHAFYGRTEGRLVISAVLHADQLVLEFTDDGNGIDPAHMGRIFDPFFTTRLGQGGSGLGLSISRNIATGVLGGSLSVSSQLESGSCFRLSIPTVAPNAVPMT